MDWVDLSTNTRVNGVFRSVDADGINLMPPLLSRRVAIKFMSQDILFEVATPLGFTVRTSTQYWQKIITKHPDLAERLELIKMALAAPDEIRRSSRDVGILLFYLATDKRWAVAVARRLNGDGFLITAYQTDTIKEGETIWHK